MKNHSPFASVINQKLHQMKLEVKDVIAPMSKACNCSEQSVRQWFDGFCRPSRKYLAGIASVMRIHESRLDRAWMAGAVACTPNAKRLQESRQQSKVANNSFQPSKDKVSITDDVQVIATLMSFDEERRTKVIELVEGLTALGVSL